MIIYQITNQVNGKTYIGKTTKTLEERFRGHLYEASYERVNTYLYKAIRKYGESNFTAKVIENQVPETELNDRERYWIKKLNPEYNLTEGGEGGDMSKCPNWIEAIKKVHSKRKPEDYATYGMLGKKQTDNQKRVISNKNSYPVVCEGVEYPSIKAAEEYYKSIGTPKSVRKRIDSPKHSDWYRLREKRPYTQSNLHSGRRS